MQSRRLKQNRLAILRVMIIIETVGHELRFFAVFLCTSAEHFWYGIPTSRATSSMVTPSHMSQLEALLISPASPRISRRFSPLILRSCRSTSVYS